MVIMKEKREKAKRCSDRVGFMEGGNGGCLSLGGLVLLQHSGEKGREDEDERIWSSSSSLRSLSSEC